MKVFIGVVVIAAMLSGCGKSERDMTAIDESLLPSSDVIMSWIALIEEQGYRRPGWPADEWTEQWIAKQFSTWGLEGIKREPIPVKRWAEKQWSLEVWPKNDPTRVTALKSWPIPFSKAVESMTTELVLANQLDGVSLGKAAVVEYSLLTFSQQSLRDEVATWAYDPDGDFNRLNHTVPVGARFEKVMDLEAEAGASAYIGILNFPWETDRYYVPYDGKSRDIPGVYLSRSEGERLLTLMKNGPVMARFKVDVNVSDAVNHNIYATLPGMSDEWIVIGSHHDGPWNSAVEDASGVAMVMAQARYWSQVPKARRPHNMMFLLTGGHMSGGSGLVEFSKKHREFFENKVVAEIHLEHIAREARVVDGRLVPTEKPEVRWWFTSYIPRLEKIVGRAICKENITRSLMMPPSGWPTPEATHPPTDASLFFLTTPVISLLAAPMYLFDPDDRLMMVHEPSLSPISRAVIRMINELGNEDAEGLRAGEYTPPRPELLSSSCQQLGASG